MWCCAKSCLLYQFPTAPGAETSNDLSSWVGEELNVSDRPELTSAKVVVSGGTLTLVNKVILVS